MRLRAGVSALLLTRILLPASGGAAEPPSPATSQEVEQQTSTRTETPGTSGDESRKIHCGGAWPRARVPDPLVATILRRALDEARQRLGELQCQEIVAEFRDANGRPLAEKLAKLGVDLQQYLELVHFRDGSQ